MAQTPSRDIINTAVVDLRFYNGSNKNYANNSNVATFTSPIIAKAGGVPALIYCTSGASQTWMNPIVTTEVTFEALFTLDMLMLGTSETQDYSATLISGDWNVGFVNYPDSGETTKLYLVISFNGDQGSVHSSYVSYQELSSSVISSFRGSPIHLIVSAKYISSTSMEVTTYINGHYSNDTTLDWSNHAMVTSPTNVLLNSAKNLPVYFIRMWNSYMEDELIFKGMLEDAKKILPSGTFVPGSGTFTFGEPA